jgi:hypothetical protein
MIPAPREGRHSHGTTCPDGFQQRVHNGLGASLDMSERAERRVHKQVFPFMHSKFPKGDDNALFRRTHDVPVKFHVLLATESLARAAKQTDDTRGGPPRQFIFPVFAVWQPTAP